LRSIVPLSPCGGEDDADRDRRSRRRGRLRARLRRRSRGGVSRALGATPNFPEYPSAHACHSGAVVKALQSFFGTDRVPLSLDSRITHATRHYERLHDVVDDVDLARVLVGFHFRGSDLTGSNLGRRVGRYVVEHDFQPTS
jgi:hypothetical protein